MILKMRHSIYPIIIFFVSILPFKCLLASLETYTIIAEVYYTDFPDEAALSDKIRFEFTIDTSVSNTIDDNTFYDAIVSANLSLTDDSSGNLPAFDMVGSTNLNIRNLFGRSNLSFSFRNATINTLGNRNFNYVVLSLYEAFEFETTTNVTLSDVIQLVKTHDFDFDSYFIINSDYSPDENSPTEKITASFLSIEKVSGHRFVYNLGEHGTLISGSLSQSLEIEAEPIAPIFSVTAGWVFSGWFVHYNRLADETVFTATYTQETLPQKLTFPLFENDQTLDNHWYKSWFGFYSGTEANDAPWVYHYHLGWLQIVPDTANDSMWFWHNDTQSWGWTQLDIWPSFFHRNFSSWLYLPTDKEKESSWLYSYRNGAWFQPN